MPPNRHIVYPDADAATLALLQGPWFHRIEALGRFTGHEGTPADDLDFAARVGDADALILGWQIPDAALRAGQNLKVIAFTGIGAANHVNLPLARELGITVCNTPSYANQTVAEHAMALMLAAARQIPALDRDCRAAGWDQDRPGFDLNGKTLGLVGLGGIGARTAQLARAFGMTVIAWTARPSPERAQAAGVDFVSLEALFDASDVVSLHLALTPKTAGLITAGHLARMKPGALLINTARGEIVEEAALMEALESGRISAGLDVFHREPLPGDHPLRQMENVVITPHTAYNTPEANHAILDLAVTSLEAFYAGAPIHVVNA